MSRAEWRVGGNMRSSEVEVDHQSRVNLQRRGRIMSDSYSYFAVDC
jgi:hypothetical protein